MAKRSTRARSTGARSAARGGSRKGRAPRKSGPAYAIWPTRFPRIGRPWWLRLLGWTLLGYALLTLLFVLPLRVLHPPVTAFMLHQTQAYERSYRWVPIEAISTELALAVIASEDQRFLLHHGVDFGAVRQALSEDSQAVRGASTMTQQLVKNLYLWPGRSLLRKGLEAVLAVTFDAVIPKRRILELYLNVVEFGPGIYGAAVASEAFFIKPAAGITAREAALLATALPNPAVYRVDAPSDYMRERQAWVLEQMERLKRQGLPAELKLR